MRIIPVVLRERIVAAYESGRSGTYKDTAALFGVGEATVSRLLRLRREKNSLEPLPRGGNNPRAVDLDWLRDHAEVCPNARLLDRVAAWEKESGVTVSDQTMSMSMRAIGWTHKKNSNGSRARAPRRSGKAKSVS